MKLHKLLTIILFSLIIFFAIDSNSFASFTFNYNDKTVTLPDLPFDINEHPDYVFGYNSNTTYYIIAYPSSEHDNFFRYETSSMTVAYYKTGTTTRGEWDYWEISSKNPTTWSKHVTRTALLKYVNGYLISSGVNIYTDDTYSEIYLKASGTDNDYNYDDYVLPELPKDLYKYNYIVPVSYPDGVYYYVLCSFSQPVEFYRNGCSSCQEIHSNSSDCPGTGTIDYCEHMLSPGYYKCYFYDPVSYPSNDEYGGNSLWKLSTSDSGFYSNYNQHMHKHPEGFLEDRLIYSDFTITLKSISGMDYRVLEPIVYENFKNHVISNGSDYVLNENYYNNQLDPDEDNKTFIDVLLDGIYNLFKGLFEFLFVPEERIFRGNN